ncbi:MAG: hypothetical protein IKI40_09280 [Treponema sp.]|nr:hypothetical protein [Treponema sp.]
MTKEEYEDFVLRYKGCGACFPMYHTLSRFEKMWFTAIQKDVAELEKANEWHYVKDEKPKELNDVLCFVIHNEHRYVLQGYLRDGRWVLSPLGTFLNNKDVIAWKEIVFPKKD